MQEDKFSVGVDSFIIELPRLMLAVATVLHEGQQCSDLHPPNEQPLLRWFVLLVCANIEAKIEIAPRSAMDDIHHSMSKPIHGVLLVTYPSRKHHVFWSVSQEGFALEAVHRPSHYQSIGIYRFCVVVEGAIILVGVFMVCDVPLKGGRVGHGTQQVDQGISPIAFPTVEAKVDSTVHKSLKPFLGIGIEVINEGSLSMPPMDCLPLIQEIPL